ncbi:MAG: hypothetical protein WAR37_02070 [Candidatus Microsaccharimonas sp.]
MLKRVIIAGTIALLTLVVLGTIWQDSILQAFALSDSVSQAIRMALVVMLLGLLVSTRPRSVEFRTALGLASAGLTLGVAFMLSQYYIAPVDAFLYIEVAILFALEAIESREFTKLSSEKSFSTSPVKNEKIII